MVQRAFYRSISKSHEWPRLLDVLSLCSQATANDPNQRFRPAEYVEMLVDRGRAFREVVVDKVQRVVDGCDRSVHIRDAGRAYWTNLESDFSVAVRDVLVAQPV